MHYSIFLIFLPSGARYETRARLGLGREYSGGHNPEWQSWGATCAHMTAPRSSNQVAATPTTRDRGLPTEHSTRSSPAVMGRAQAQSCDSPPAPQGCTSGASASPPQHAFQADVKALVLSESAGVTGLQEGSSSDGDKEQGGNCSGNEQSFEVLLELPETPMQPVGPPPNCSQAAPQDAAPTQVFSTPAPSPLSLAPTLPCFPIPRQVPMNAPCNLPSPIDHSAPALAPDSSHPSTFASLVKKAFPPLTSLPPVIKPVILSTPPRPLYSMAAPLLPHPPTYLSSNIASTSLTNVVAPFPPKPCRPLSECPSLSSEVFGGSSSLPLITNSSHITKPTVLPLEGIEKNCDTAQGLDLSCDLNLMEPASAQEKDFAHVADSDAGSESATVEKLNLKDLAEGEKNAQGQYVCTACNVSCGSSVQAWEKHYFSARHQRNMMKAKDQKRQQAGGCHDSQEDNERSGDTARCGSSSESVNDADQALSKGDEYPPEGVCSPPLFERVMRHSDHSGSDGVPGGTSLAGDSDCSPPLQAEGAGASKATPKLKVCNHFVVGRCSYGDRCW